MATRSPYSSISGETSFSPPNDLPEFVDIDERYKCCVCRNVLKHPVQTKCGHRLCEGCVDQLFKEGEPVTCPAADEFCEKLRKNEIYPDVSARREIRNLPVYCPYKNLGCGKTVPWKDYTKHTEDCSFKPNECPNKLHGCSEVLPRKALDSHIKECRYRQVQCDKCLQFIAFSMAQKHKESDCPEATIACPYNCGAKQMKRRELEDHFKHCDKKPQQCKFKSIGCQFTGNQYDVREHEKKDIAQHLELVTIYTGNMDLQSMDIREKINEITTERDQLRTQLDSTLQQNHALKQTVSRLESTLRDLRLKMVAQTERVIKLERRVEELPRREQLEQQNRELATLRERTQTLTEQIAGMEGGQTVARYGSLSTMAGTKRKVEAQSHILEWLKETPYT